MCANVVVLRREFSVFRMSVLLEIEIPCILLFLNRNRNSQNSPPTKLFNWFWGFKEAFLLLGLRRFDSTCSRFRIFRAPPRLFSQSLMRNGDVSAWSCVSNMAATVSILGV